MADKTPPTRVDPLLNTAQRTIAGATGVFLLVAASAMARIPVDKRVAAPECGTKNLPRGCAVVTDEFSYTVPLALCALAALLLLMAITGRMWSVKFGDNALGPDKPDVAPASEKEVAKETKANKTKPTGSTQNINPVAPPEVATEPTAQTFSDLFKADPQVAAALDERWRDWYGVSVSDNVIEFRRATGKGNHSWFVKAVDPDGEAEWTRVSKGGRSGGITTSRSS